MHPVHATLLFATLAAGLVALFAPALLAAAWRRRTHVPFRVFFYGMLTFFVFQPVLRLSWQAPLFHALARDPRWHLPMLVFAAFTAGLFEECGRWVAFRYLLPKRRDAQAAVMLGLGHGGLEAMLLVGVGFLALGTGYLLAHAGVVVPEGMQSLIGSQFAGMTLASPFLALLERVSALAAHVGLSLIVLQAFVRGTKRWLAYAIAIHFLFDLVAVLLSQYWHVDTLLIEAILFACGAALLWRGIRLSRWETGAGDARTRHAA
ncbi:TPA: YhfC family intramembrane metalloprotease [Burkholderia stabilis]|uniref:YhfC family intramembrane metalloprotease n=1 Tax=Burkholderia stabilis TaxID=95485 RepID=UPI0015886ACB|nr:YhfC family glutamic-type intramembrane protease [Burkholderia stabilis]HDR9586216.1 YhfC family intramembrane metalloprotease [Burkholderia stabilis]HDR9653127.1 YhfC family intramembrane metalloprotease [Burkholderia stabilis]HDR9659980.1 YhfC family intramembrane metalloprotease [Burkholderia stabilis]HDR9683327.1 YhfC family intramembrane metalloprotease [Burkholderia stabilis]